MRWLWTSGLLLVWAALARGFSRTALYPFGRDQGDERLVIADDVSSGEVQLDRAITYFNHLYRSIYVSTSSSLLPSVATGQLADHYVIVFRAVL